MEYKLHGSNPRRDIRGSSILLHETCVTDICIVAFILSAKTDCHAFCDIMEMRLREGKEKQRTGMSGSRYGTDYMNLMMRTGNIISLAMDSRKGF